MVTLALSVLSHKFGMELIVLVDAIMAKYGSTETVCAQIISNGMDTVVCLAQMVKLGIH